MLTVLVSQPALPLPRQCCGGRMGCSRFCRSPHWVEARRVAGMESRPGSGAAHAGRDTRVDICAARTGTPALPMCPPDGVRSEGQMR
jgi:hypothetical protein